jgi:glycosyltransferase involved in cell wall biosynthesis
MKMNKGISVIICCYNSVSRIGKTLEYLSNQILNGFDCEIVLVDNNCTDSTVGLALETWSSLGSKYPLNIVKQFEPGLSMARKMGIQSSQYDILLFCDDDNWLHPDYISLSYTYLLGNESVGILGGHPEFRTSIDVPTWFVPYQECFATGVQGDKIGNILPERSYLFGAGMVVRKKILHLFDEIGIESILSDRNGDIVSSGGDIEFCVWVRKLGYELHYLENLKLVHQIDRKRIDWNYMIRLFKGFAESNIVLDLYSYHFFKSTGKVFAGTELVFHTKHAKFGYRYLYFILLLKSVKDWYGKYSFGTDTKESGNKLYLDRVYQETQLKYYFKLFFSFKMLNTTIANYSRSIEGHQLKK